MPSTRPPIDTERLRLFFALWPDPPLRHALAGLGQRAAPPAGRPVPSANLHLTLAFLGSTPAALLPLVRQCADSIAGEAVTVTLDRIEWWRRPRLLCAVATRYEPPLLELVDALGDRLQGAGLPVDRRPFRGHVTLVRKVTVGGPMAMLEQPVTWRSAHFCLVASETAPAGARYRPLAWWQLAAG